MTQMLATTLAVREDRSHSRSARTRTRRAPASPPLALARKARDVLTLGGSLLDRAGPVADAANGEDDLGMVGVVLDLRAQALYVDVDDPGVVRGLPVSPHLFEELLAREHLPRLAR